MKLIKLPKVLDLRAKSKTSHYDDIKNGLMTPPIKVGTQAVAWPEREVIAINAARVAGKSDEEIRLIVSRLVEERQRPSVVDAK